MCPSVHHLTYVCDIYSVHHLTDVYSTTSDSGTIIFYSSIILQSSCVRSTHELWRIIQFVCQSSPPHSFPKKRVPRPPTPGTKISRRRGGSPRDGPIPLLSASFALGLVGFIRFRDVFPVSIFRSGRPDRQSRFRGTLEGDAGEQGTAQEETPRGLNVPERIL